MSRAGGAITRGRRAAEKLMIDSCTVSYKTGQKIRDTDNGTEVDEYAVAFTSKCQFKAAGLQPDDTFVAGQRRVLSNDVIKLPIATAQIDEDALIECVAVGKYSDPRLVGRKWLAGAPHNASFATATRLELKELP